MSSASSNDNGIYYFLGNITSHVLHALPLYKELGGTFVVLSKRAERELRRYDIPVIRLNDKPRQWTRFSAFVTKPVYHYLRIGRDIKKTTTFLNENAKIVLFYEPYDFAPEVRLTKPKTVFLTHGNMLKDYMNNAGRLEIIKQYDYMAAIGPYLKKQFIEHDGIDPHKLVDIGIARTDQVLQCRGTSGITLELANTLGIDQGKPIFSYLPTFWGASSIYNLGKELVRNFPEQYNLIFRPHPQTPEKLLHEYRELITAKPNVVYATEGAYSELGLLDLYRISDAFIGDVSSVMLEAILTEKPLIFAYDSGEHRQDQTIYEQIHAVAKRSKSISPETIETLPKLLAAALAEGVDPAIWRQTLGDIFFHADGTSVSSIASFIRSL